LRITWEDTWGQWEQCTKTFSTKGQSISHHIKEYNWQSYLQTELGNQPMKIPNKKKKKKTLKKKKTQKKKKKKIYKKKKKK